MADPTTKRLNPTSDNGDIAVGFGIAKAVAFTALQALFPGMRSWHLLNTSPGENSLIDGQYEPTNLTQGVSANYSRTNGVGRQDPITQFVSGNADTLTFQARYFRRDTLHSVKEDIDRLLSWVKPDPTTGHPRVCLFWVGDGSITMKCTIDSIQNVVYDSFTFGGGIRGATMQINLVQYTEFKFVSGPPPRTRYARAQAGDYHELLAMQEYNDPMLGVIVRQEAPKQQLLMIGDIVKLPSKEAIRRIPIVPQSVPLRGLTLRGASPQRDLREATLQRLNIRFTSHVIPRGL